MSVTHAQKSPAQHAAEQSRNGNGKVMPAVPVLQQKEQDTPEPFDTHTPAAQTNPLTAFPPPAIPPGNGSIQPQRFRADQSTNQSAPGAHPVPVLAKFAPPEPANVQKKAALMPFQPQAAKPNRTNLPDQLKTGIEQLSGYAMDDVKVHYQSDKPAQLQAHAYAQGTDIHIAPGQEKHLPHEAWHVIQQKQGRVQATQLKRGLPVNTQPGLEQEASLMGESALSAASRAQVYQPIQLRVSSVQSYTYQFVEIDLSDKAWLEEWYQKAMKDKSSDANKKYIKMLNELVSSGNKTELTKALEEADLSKFSGDFLSAIMQFFMHIAPYQASGKQGKDRAGQGYDYHGEYFRSSPKHPLSRLHYRLLAQHGIAQKPKEKTAVTPTLPLNRSLLTHLGARDLKAPEHLVKDWKSGELKFQGTKGKPPSTASVGLPSNNLITLGNAQDIATTPLFNGTKERQKKLKTDLFMLPREGAISTKDRSRTLKGTTSTADVLSDIAGKLSGKAAPGYTGNSFHDYMLRDRGDIVGRLGAAVNTTSAKSGVSAIGSEGHPSLLLNSRGWGPGTSELSQSLVGKWNTGNTGSDVDLSQRGSFGFLRPTVSDTGASMRIWPGYAPAEGIVPGLNKALRPEPKRGQPSINPIDPARFKTDRAAPVLHIEALKTAVRHALIVLKKKLPDGLPKEKESVGKWLQTRFAINLHKADFLLTNFNAEDLDINQHYQKTAQVIDNLQEYAFTYTSLTTETKSGESLTFANDPDDPYEKHFRETLKTKIKGNFTVFYLDSGEQAIAEAAILASQFSKIPPPEATPTATEKKGGLGTSAVTAPVEGTSVPKTPYVNENSYFELPFAENRFNLEPIEGDISAAKVLSTDMSPVITDPAKKGITQAAITKSVSAAIPGKVAILDMTNAPLDRLNSLVSLDSNYIVVESLTKHAQLGADKMLMGRLVAVGNESFLALAVKLVGATAKASYNSLAHAFRRNMDEASYTKNVSTGVLFEASASGGTVTTGTPVSGGRTGAVKAEPAPEQFKGTTTATTNTGITNLGVTCYLAAGLNMLAYNYADYFEADKARGGEKAEITELRVAVKTLLDKIKANQLVTKAEVTALTGRMAGLSVLKKAEFDESKKTVAVAPITDSSGAISTPVVTTGVDTGASKTGETVKREPPPVVTKPVVKGTSQSTAKTKKTDAAALKALADASKARVAEVPVPVKTLVGGEPAISRNAKKRRNKKAREAQKSTGELEVVDTVKQEADKKLKAETSKLSGEWVGRQQDTTEMIFNKLFDLLDIDQTANKLNQITSRHHVETAAEAPFDTTEEERAKLSTLAETQTTAADPKIDLPINDAADLAAALLKYERPDNEIADYKYLKGGAAYRSTIKQRLAFGTGSPAVFTITLKRFSSPDGGITIEKLKNKVVMPKAFVLNGHKYHLNTVIYHHGEYGSGHYTTSIKKGEEWFHHNDQTVGKHDSFTHDKDFGYIYTYQKGLASTGETPVGLSILDD